MSQSTINNKKKTGNLIRYDTVIVISAILYAIAEYYNISIPVKWSIGAFLGVIIIAAIGLLVKSRAVKVIVSLIILAMAFTQFYMQYSLNRLVMGRSKSVETTSLVVVKESPFETMSDANGARFGYSNSVTQESIENVKSKVQMGNETLESDDVRGASNLLNGAIDVLVLNEASRGTITEVIPDFNERTRVLESLDVKVQKVDTTKHVNTSKEGFTVLISGIDTDGPVTSVARSDVNILMTVNPVTHEILTTSIPRDSYIPLTCLDNNYDKLTHSGVRGVDCTVSSLENYLGITINYYARVNFTSVINILDVVGPIDVYSHYSFEAYDGSWFNEGINTLDSYQALVFSRERKNVPGGDITRGIHQQEVIKATFSKVVSSISPWNMEALISQFNQSVDTDFGSNALSALLQLQLDRNPSWNFETFAITGEHGMTPTYMYPNQNLSVIYPNETDVQTARDKINSMK